MTRVGLRRLVALSKLGDDFHHLMRVMDGCQFAVGMSNRLIPGWNDLTGFLYGGIPVR